MRAVSLSRLPIRPSPEEEERAGFTLLEVLVALTILAISLSVLLEIFSQGLTRARDNEQAMQARVLAQSLLARTNVAPEPGDMAGIAGNGMRWKVEVAPYAPSSDPTDTSLQAATVTAKVAWQSNGHQRSLSLSTLRILPKDSAR